MKIFYDFTATDIRGNSKSMSAYKGKVLLVVNVASVCAFTPQYTALQKLYEKYHGEGLEILAFPCNQFREQEAGTLDEIQNFCQTTYRVTFPLFEKIEVNGVNTHPLYDFLKKEAKGFLGTKSIKWNFTKFLVDRDGNVLRRYAPWTKPQSMEKYIEELLKEFVITKNI